MSEINNCQNCGRTNDASSVFCRFCGMKMARGAQSAAAADYSAPRPYSWKTDEFQTKAGARSTAAGPAVAAPMTMHGGSHMPYADPRVRCPICSSLVAPRIERKISTAGWITFALLLVFFFPLFWIGFLIKEDVAFCPVCDSKLS